MKQLIYIILLSFLSIQIGYAQNETPPIVKQLSNYKVPFRIYEKGIFNWSEKDLINNIINISSDTTKVNPIKRNKQIILIVLKYVSYSNHPTTILEVKGNSNYIFEPTNEETEHKNLTDLLPSNNKFGYLRSYSRSGGLIMNEQVYDVVEMSTAGYYLEYGYLTMTTVTHFGVE